jgi:uncharacterized protein
MNCRGNGPRLLVLMVTTDCNLRCRYCYANGGDERAHMDWAVAKRAVDLMRESSSSFTVQFSGGEPLLNFDIIQQVLFYIEDLGVDARSQLQTNATLVSSDMANRLKDLGIGVGISLDGPPAVNDKLRPFFGGRGSTGAVVAGAKNLSDAGIRVGMTCVLTALNVAGLPDLVGLASYLGNVEGISIDLLRPIGRASGELIVDPTLAAQYLDAAVMYAEEIAGMGGWRVKFREIERMRNLLSSRKKREHHCYFDACQSLMVRPGGDAYPCSSLTFPEFYLGNILDKYFENNLQDKLAWAKELIELPAQCKSCSEYWLCGGPCPANLFSRGGDVMLECAVKKVFMKHARGTAGR